MDCFLKSLLTRELSPAVPKYVPGVVSKYGKWTGINVKGIKWLVKRIKVTRINTYPPDEKTAYPHLFRTSTADNPKLTPTVVFCPSTTESPLRYGRDHNPVLNLSDTWRRPAGGILRRLFLRRGSHRPPQDDLAALRFDRDIPGIGLRIAEERALDLLLEVRWQHKRLVDPDEIGDAFDPCMAPYDAFCVSHLEDMFDLALERHPALADRYVHFASRNRCIPRQRVKDGSGKDGVAAL